MSQIIEISLLYIKSSTYNTMHNIGTTLKRSEYEGNTNRIVYYVANISPWHTALRQNMLENLKMALKCDFISLQVG